MMQKYFNWINLVIFCMILLIVYIDARVMTQKQFNRIYLFLFFCILADALCHFSDNDA